MSNLVDSLIKVPINLVELFRSLLEENKQSCNFFADNSWNECTKGACNMFYNTHRNAVPQFIYDFAKEHRLDLLWRDLDGYGADDIIQYDYVRNKSFSSNVSQQWYEKFITSKSYYSM